MDSDTTHMMAASKVPMLKPGKFEIWRMRIKQYIQMIDYSLWDVIENGPTLLKIQVVEGVTTFMSITSVEDKARSEGKKLQKLVSQLELLGENLSQEAVNQKLLRSLSPEWNTQAMSNTTAQAINTAIGISTAGTQVNTANIDNLSDAIIYAFLASQLSSPQLVNEDLEQIHPDDLEKMDLKWKMAMLTMRARRGHFAREFRAPKSQDTKHKESIKRTMLVETPASTALVSCDGLGGYDWSDQGEEGPNYTVMAYTSTSSVSKIVDNCKKGLGYENYNDVLPPYTGNFMPPKPDLSYIGLDEFAVKPVVENKSSEEVTKAVRKNHDAPIVEDWVSDDEEENVTQPKIVKKTFKPSIPKIEFVKPRLQEKKAIVNDVQGNVVNVVKASACWVWKPKTKVIDHVSKHSSESITLKKFNYVDAQGRSKSVMAWVPKRWNMSYLTDYKEINGGYVAFGGNPKGGKITGKVFSYDWKNLVRVPHGGRGLAKRGLLVSAHDASWSTKVLLHPA
nr:ribonuclease H-like domain-containing protein [Tanacetum cinerariifolium]